MFQFKDVLLCVNLTHERIIITMGFHILVRQRLHIEVRSSFRYFSIKIVLTVWEMPLCK